MNPIDSLITDLKSSDPATRDRAALEIMEIGDEKAFDPLVNAIQVPANANNRGTLVYALGAFDCTEHLDLLVDLCLKGNFEVSTSAFSIIADFELAPIVTAQIKALLGNYDVPSLPHEHSPEAYDALSELIS